MSVAYKRKKTVQKKEVDHPVIMYDEEEFTNPMDVIKIDHVINQIETDLDKKKKEKSKEKNMQLLIKSTITVGEQIVKTNKRLDSLIKIQTFNNKLELQTLQRSQIKTGLKQRDKELQELGSGAPKIKTGSSYMDPPKASKMMNRFCFVQSAILLFLIFASLGIILGNGLGWMEIKVENCIYLCCMVIGLLIGVGIFNILVFICIKKCYFKQNEKYFRIV